MHPQPAHIWLVQGEHRHMWSGASQRSGLQFQATHGLCHGTQLNHLSADLPGQTLWTAAIMLLHYTIYTFDLLPKNKLLNAKTEGLALQPYSAGLASTVSCFQQHLHVSGVQAGAVECSQLLLVTVENL